MKIYFDTEFTGLHKGTTLVSIGLVDETNRSFYAELTDYDSNQLDHWLKENVIAKLLFNHCNPFYIATPSHTSIKGNKTEVRSALTEWLSDYKQIILHSDCLMYDMVLFNDIWGSSFDVPKQISYIPIDLCSIMYYKGIDPDVNRFEFLGLESTNQHNALVDAKIIKSCFEKIGSGDF